VNRYILCLFLAVLSLPVAAQQVIRGVIKDSETGEGIAYASVVYDGRKGSVVADAQGRFNITRKQSGSLSFSAVGYKKRNLKLNEIGDQTIEVTLSPDKRMLAEVKIGKKRSRYSRRNNPAVELMRRVVAAKKKTDLAVNDYYQYTKYEKITLAMNDATPEMMAKKPFSNFPWLKDQVEPNVLTGKPSLPISVDETVSQQIYRRQPHQQRTIIQGQRSKGINDFFQTGDIINTVVKDVFTDVDLYEDHIRLLQFPFISPISEEGIGFYRYYIEDTLAVGGDQCIHLHFLPNNQHDRGFRGDLYILNDTTWHVRRCELTIPKMSNVNFVENMQVKQDYQRMPDGQWVLTLDDMAVELRLYDFIPTTGVVTRTTRMSDYSFNPIDDKLFKGSRKEVTDADARMRDTTFWNSYRKVDLTRSEERMDDFMNGIQNIKGFKFGILVLKTLLENSIETGKPNYIDICPVNTLISRNFIDGWRTRMSLKTTANLNPHFFLAGYYARGFKSKNNYYSAEATYSLNPKNYLPHEFPRRTITVQVSKDVCSPGDRFMETDKDNLFVAMKWAKADKMMFYDRQQVTFEYESSGGLRATVNAKHEEDVGAGALTFNNLRTTELRTSLRYAPGETYINNKLRRRVINHDAPVFSLSHTHGFDGLLNGDYDYNYTEAGIFKRFWLSSWGKADFTIKAGAQWNSVPFPLLIHPAANLSYMAQRETFDLINNMEFLNDRFASFMVTWDMNGRLLNRVPFIKNAHWREFISIRSLWGKLTDKNNPTLAANDGSEILMAFPEGVNIMDPKKPYVEVMVGIHNIFQFFNIDFVRRLNYNELSTSPKWGLRYSLSLTF
jgi:hypothetical protein